MSPEQSSNSPAPHRPHQPSMHDGELRQITMWGLLDAFRRRWVPAVAIAVPAAVLMGSLIWELLPPNYESSAVIQVHQYEQILAKATDKATAEFNTFRNSQMAQMKTRPVLLEALRREGVRDCRTLADVDYPVEWLNENLDIEEDTSPEFIRISLSGQYPEDLALIVNAVKDAYMDEVVYNDRNREIENLRKLRERFNAMDQRVTEHQDRIDALAQELGTGNAEITATNQAYYQLQRKGLQEELRQINTQIRNEVTAREYLREHGLSATMMTAVPGDPATASGPTTAAAANSPQQQLVLLRRQIRQYETQLRDHNHPDLKRLRQEAAELEAMLSGAESAGADTPGVPISPLAWLERRRDRLEVEISELSEEMDTMGRNSTRLQRERQDIEISMKTRDNLAMQINNKEIELHAPQRVQEIQTANVPERQNQKKRVRLASLGLLGTFSLIIGGFTLFEWFSYRIASAADVTRQTGIRLLGSIPSPDKGGLLGLGIFAGSVDPDEWQRAVIESMDVVRTCLLRHIDPSRPASILITSASANEGKTTVSCQLAASLARIGRRVALVDCDFRRPSAHELVDGQPGPGLSEFLRGDVELSDIYQPTQADGLTFVPAGAVDQSALQALSADGGRSLIDRLKSEFDFVIIDTSPLLFVAEPSMLAQNADIVLMSTRKDLSRVPYVVQSRDSLRSLSIPLLGAVMVGADSDLQRQTYGYRQQIGHRQAVATVRG